MSQADCDVTNEINNSDRSAASSFSVAYGQKGNHSFGMPTAKENSPPYSEADYYGFVLTGLLGLIDDAEASECDHEGIELLRLAREIFFEEFQRRHPGHWKHKQKG